MYTMLRMLSHCFLFGNMCLRVMYCWYYGCLEIQVEVVYFLLEKSCRLTKNGDRHKVKILYKFLYLIVLDLEWIEDKECICGTDL